MSISIIGLGTVGLATYKEISKKYKNTYGIDKNPQITIKISKKHNLRDRIIKSKVYLINVYSTLEILEVLKSISKIKHSTKPIIIIESTIDPKYIKQIIKLAKPNKKSNLVVCPHRLNNNDKKHQVFNLNRVIGGATKECLEKGIEFYSNFMNSNLLTITDLNHAIMSKIVENAYRFTEIAIAEEIKPIIDSDKNLKINFEELRRCTNSKWNIDIKEARDGIYGKCLSKDTDILNSTLPKNKFFKLARKIDNSYKSEVNK